MTTAQISKPVAIKPPQASKKVYTRDTPSTTGRYSVGEKLLVAAQVSCRPGKGSTPASYMVSSSPMSFWMYREHGVSHRKFVFLELEVVEHHKVYWDYDEDKSKAPEYDGYVLKDAAGNVYHNQYPRASYGQVSDRGNRVFHLIPAAENDRTISAMFEDEKKRGIPNEYYLAESLADELIGSTRDRTTVVQSLTDPAVKEHMRYDESSIAFRDNMGRMFLKELQAHPLYGRKYKIEEVIWHQSVDKDGKAYEFTRHKTLPF